MRHVQSTFAEKSSPLSLCARTIGDQKFEVVCRIVECTGSLAKSCEWPPKMAPAMSICVFVSLSDFLHSSAKTLQSLVHCRACNSASSSVSKKHGFPSICCLRVCERESVYACEGCSKFFSCGKRHRQKENSFAEL